MGACNDLALVQQGMQRSMGTHGDPKPPPASGPFPALLLLRRAKETVGSHVDGRVRSRVGRHVSSPPPLVIAHSLLGDHRGYGRLWKNSLHQNEVHVLLLATDSLILTTDY